MRIKLGARWQLGKHGGFYLGHLFEYGDGFWAKLRSAPLVNIKIPEDARIDNLLEDYVLSDKAELETAFRKIDKKLGGQNLKITLEALENNDYATAARIALCYYDKTYQHGLDNSTSTHVKHLIFNHGKPAIIAQELIKLKLHLL